ncbi:MAG: phage major capsid protein, partial [Thermoplasmata archaeon]
MSDRTIASKQERKNTIIREMSSILSADKNGAASARYKELDAELSTLEETLKMLTRIERSMASKPAAPVVNVPETVTTASERSAVQTAEQRAQVNRQLRTLLVTGRVTNELRDIVNGTDAQGQALLAELYSTEWTAAMRNYAPIASQLSVTHAETSAPMKIAAFDDTANLALYLDPTNTHSASFLTRENDPANIFSTTSAATDALVTSLVYSKQFAGSGIPNLESWLQKTLFSRISRSLELALLTGIASYWNGTTVTTAALPNVQGIIP